MEVVFLLPFYLLLLSSLLFALQVVLLNAYFLNFAFHYVSRFVSTLSSVLLIYLGHFNQREEIISVVTTL